MNYALLYRLAGMAALSVAIAIPLRLTSRHLTRVYSGISAAVGLGTFALGCHIVYRIGVAMA